jgi:hypothetical protein
VTSAGRIAAAAAALLLAAGAAEAQGWLHSCRPFVPPPAPAVIATDDVTATLTPGDPAAFLAGATGDCPRCDLRGAQLQRRDLAGADLRGADLSGASLHRAKLAGAQLDRARLTGANLNLADLKRASLVGASLEKALLYGADMAASVLIGADLTDARRLLSRADSPGRARPPPREPCLRIRPPFQCRSEHPSTSIPSRESMGWGTCPNPRGCPEGRRPRPWRTPSGSPPAPP